ncbi:MAG: DUF4129 domain-containing protein [Actinomycetota bacterium]
MRRALLLSIAVVLATPTGAAAATIDELLDRIDRARELAQAGASAPSPERMEDVRAALGLPDQVTVADRAISVPADPFLEDLGGRSAAEFEAAAERLEALAEAIGSRPVVDPVALREDLDRAYGGLESEPGLFERIRRFLASLLRAATDAATEGLRGWVGWAALAILGLVAVVFLRRLGIGAVPQASAGGEARLPGAADWRRRAEEARARGDLGEAVACAYRAMVAALAEGGMVEDRPSLTAGEVRAATPAGEVADATRRYERVRYGLAPAGDEDLRALLGAARRAA